MNQKDMNDEMEIDLLDLAYMLMDHWHHLLLCLLAGALALNAFAFFFIEPTYESTAKLYVVSTSDDSVVNLNDLNLGTSLTSDYEELMFSYPVLNRVIEKLKLDMDYEDLAKLYTEQSVRYACAPDHSNNNRSSAIYGPCRDNGRGSCFLSAGYNEYQGPEYCTACKTT